ncbi:hypothetical protein ACFSHP_19520 [Novosphingobium panipatense]
MNSHLPVGRLAAYLEALSREKIWSAIVVTTALIAYADYMLPAIAAAPLYIPVICAACWGLGAREGYFVATITASLAVVPSLRSGMISRR